MKGVFFGDEHISKASVVNFTHVDPTLGRRGVRIAFWLLVPIVCLAGLGLGELVALAVMR